MKIEIYTDDKAITVERDFSDLNGKTLGLVGQLFVELELLKDELLSLYSDNVELIYEKSNHGKGRRS